MSDDPKRWRETEDDALAGFVAALASSTPTGAMKERVWSKIAPTLPPTTPGSGSTGGGGAGAVSSIKLIGIAGLAIATGALILGLTRTPDPPAAHVDPQPSASITIAPPPVAPAASEAPIAIEPAPSTSAPPPPTTKPATTHTVPATPSAAPTPTPSISPADRLREEAEGVRRVRQLLREKNASAALTELDRLAKLAPNGPLEEEREVLAIEALSMSGKTDVARRRAERFLDERPQSVHAARVRGFAGK